MKKRTIRKPGSAKKQQFPPGWDEKRVKQIIAYYDRQTDEEGAAEYEVAMKIEGESVMLVPTELVPEIQRLIARRHGIHR